MASFAILRASKLQSTSNVAGSLKHCTRERPTPNADPALTVSNTLNGGDTTKEILSAYNALLPEKVRSNGVRAIELLITASPEKMESMTRQQQDAYFRDALDWVGKNFGGAQNVFFSAIHRDEKTPHMHVHLVPINEKGKLSATTFLDGRDKLTALQTDFAETVGKPHGLDRGIQGSKAKHQSIKKYYAALKDSQKTQIEIAKPRVVGKGIFGEKLEKPEEVIKRLAAAAAAAGRAATDLGDSLVRRESELVRVETLRAEFKALTDLRDDDKAQILGAAVDLNLRRIQEYRAERAKREALKNRNRESGGR